ncbi:MAG: tyrosine-type recombinase/integrase [Dehalococcoidales bacterium]|nr:tyrosine-type recombinase/integrase [Dehalococcoidales bacterium]
MRGSIREKSKGSWQIQIYTGTGPDGKPRRHFETVRGRKGDAQRRLTELLSSLDKGVYTPPGRLTVAEHLNQWLDGYVKTNCSERTFDSYQSIVETHIIPTLGQVHLKQLHQQAIQTYYSKALEKVSARTVAKHHRLLSQALKYAVRQGYLGRNPCDLVDAPSWKGRPMRTLTPSEVEVLFEMIKDNHIYPTTYTAISTGLRQAELLGLRWRDIDLDMLSISVSQVLYRRRGVCEFKEPKTRHSRRRVAMTPKLASFLREYKAERESVYWQLGKPLALDDLVFASIEGNSFDPSLLSHEFARLSKKAGLESVRFHDLRHTFASLMLLRGAKPKVISEALGHASVAFTMDVYSHIIEGMQEEAMALLDEVLPVGVNGAIKSFNANLTPNLALMLVE